MRVQVPSFPMNEFLYDYWNEQYKIIFIFSLVCFFVVVFLVILSFSLSTKLNSYEKQTSYESGFEPSNSGHSQVFDLQYFIVGILFLIFDLELPFLFCGIVCLGSLPINGVFCLFFFVFILICGFMYEWKKGALDWV